MTIDELIASIEAEIDDARERETRARGELDTLISEAEAEGRRTLTNAEDERSRALFRDVDLARAAQKRSKARLEKAQAVRADEERLTAASANVRPSGVRIASRTATVRVVGEQQVYRARAEHGTALDRDGGEPSFLSDL